MLHIYNTLTRKKEKFKPIKQDEVKLYFCWPTVYNYAHIWNLRAYITADLVIKTLKFLWYNVKTLENITDIEDKTIRESQKSWESLKEYTEKFTKYYQNDIEKLWIKVDKLVPISTLIDEMVDMINILLKKWYAYIWEDKSVYYDISKFKDYWKLANLDFKWMKKNVRINNDEYEKENASDFVLWKSWKESDWENYWEKEFLDISHQSLVIKNEWKTKTQNSKLTLKGRPGWHIECSACNLVHFWPEIDIHMWWVDLIFPHHQNEIAQSEAVTWKKFARYWIHSWHLMVDWKKMSKSLNNFYTLNDIEKKYKWKICDSNLYRSFRLSFINWNYRDNIDFSFKKLEQNFNSIERIDETIKNIENYKNQIINWKIKTHLWVQIEFRNHMQEIIKYFVEKLKDDFNFVESLAIFFDFIKYINIWLRENKFSLKEIESITEMLKNFNEVFWILDFSSNQEIKLPKEVEEKLQERNKAKKEKNFSQADKLREEIEALWYEVIDDRNWSRVVRK